MSMSKPKVTLTLLPHSDRSKKFVKKMFFASNSNSDSYGHRYVHTDRDRHG
jgi:hypothetical protein